MVGDVNVPGAFRVGGTSINNTNKWITSTTGASDYCKKEDPGRETCPDTGKISVSNQA